MIDKKHVGARSEMIACAWLLGQGYEVFRNVSPFGDTDLIAQKNNEFFRFDVKTTTYSKSTGQIYTTKVRKDLIKLGVRHLYVTDDGNCQIDWAPESDDLPVLICENCSGEFARAQRTQRFCCRGCKETTLRKRRQARAGKRS